MTRDEAYDSLLCAAVALGGDRYRLGLENNRTWSETRFAKLYCPVQQDEFQWTASQIHERGPVWSRRAARVFVEKAKRVLRDEHRAGAGLAVNVRAYFFAAAVLRGLADHLDSGLSTPPADPATTALDHGRQEDQPGDERGHR